MLDKVYVLVLLLKINCILSESREFNIGLLMVKRYISDAIRFDLVHIGPAIDIAIDKCYTKYDIKLNIIPGFYENRCNETEAIGRTHDLIKNHHNKPIVAIIGPACSEDLQVVSRLTSYVGVPLLTGLGDIISPPRSSYPNLIRTSYDLLNKASSLLAFLGYFHWYKYGLITRAGDVYYDTLGKLIKSNKQYKCQCEEIYIRRFDKVIITDLDDVITKLGKCARVIVILGGDSDVRKMLYIAHEKGLTNGDYAFIYPELIQSEARGNMTWSSGSESDEVKAILKEAYQSLLIVSLNQPHGEDYKQFSDEVKYRALRDYEYEYNEKVVNYFTASFHDCVLLLCYALNKTITTNNDPFSPLLVKFMKNVTIQGVSGSVTIDDYGDRIADYALSDQVDVETGDFQVALRYFGATNEFQVISPVNWPPYGKGTKPLDEPACGFDGSLCNPEISLWHSLIVILLIVIAFILVICSFIYRKIKLEAALSNMSWKVNWEEIDFKDDAQTAISKLNIPTQKAFNVKEQKPNNGNLKGFYKGNFVSVRKISLKRIELNRAILMDIKTIRQCTHENLSRFIGACIDSPIAIISEYCDKGSLRDVLASSLSLDWTLRSSLINDIVSGMVYIHNSELQFYGALRSSNCQIDSRFCVKLSNFGLNSLRSEITMDLEFLDDDPYGKLYLSPKNDSNNCKCTKTKRYEGKYCNDCVEKIKKNDIYSFGIVLSEIITRKVPFYPYIKQKSIDDIIYEIRHFNLRPNVSPFNCSAELYHTMICCWENDINEFITIKRDIKNITNAEDNTLTEKLLNRMESYALELEIIVEERTAELVEEKKKSEELLYQILPSAVANSLKQGEAVVPDYYDSVTIYFSDIVGFTSMCSQSTPMQVIDFLNDLYSCFDSIISDFDVYKVETIGDAYMVVSGLPERNGNEHVREIALMSLQIRNSVEYFVIRHRPDEKLKLRIGIHTGPCCAGVVGHKRPRYCLFGDTVNTASRMESTGEAFKIHVSLPTKEILDTFNTFVLEERGFIDIKGKGKMITYWLLDGHSFTIKKQ